MDDEMKRNEDAAKEDTEGQTLSTSIALRRTARMILVDDENRILLIKIEDKNVHDPQAAPKRRPFWITPGGKIEEGETNQEALARELREETGITDAKFGPCVWVGEHDLNWAGRLTHLHESYYLVRAAGVQVTTDNMTSDERIVYRDHKWWSLEEMKSSNEIFLPKDLIALVEPMLKGEIPGTPISIDMSTPPQLNQ